LPGFLPSDVVTQTYFFEHENFGKYTIPIISLNSDEEHYFGYEKGIYNAGEDFDNWRLLNPDIVPNNGVSANWRRSTEYPISFELFDSSYKPLVNTNAGFRIHGGFSRAQTRKSLRLYFSSQYGRENLNHKIFNDLPFSNYQRLLLRNSGQDEFVTNMRDMVIQKILDGLKFRGQAGRPSQVFINGEYWGIHNIRERIDRYYIQQHYSIPDGQLDLLSGNREVEEGDADDYNILLSMAQNLHINENYEAVTRKMDIENFIDYQVSQIFIHNVDWPGNNIRYFRRKVSFNPNAPYGNDGRWRWILFDTDAAFGNTSTFNFNLNLLEKATTRRFCPAPNGWTTCLLGNLVENKIFKEAFINRFSDLLNSQFQPSHINRNIDSMREVLSLNLTEHLDRYRRSWNTVERWEGFVDSMKSFGERRPSIIRNQLKQRFSLSEEQILNVEVNKKVAGYVQVNSLHITQGLPGVHENAYPWQGFYFPELPVTLVAHAKSGYKFVRWEGDTTAVTDTLILVLSSNKSVIAIFEEGEPEVVPDLVHYWHFNALPSGTLISVSADSSIKGGAIITYPGSGAGYMDRVNGEGTVLNAQYEQPAGVALRVRNPSNTRELQLKIPSTGFKDIHVSWAAMRTNNGAQEQKVYYSTNEENTEWTEIASELMVPESFDVFSVNLKGIDDADDNPNLALKVIFGGSNASGASGNNRFDNISVFGIPVPEPPKPLDIVHYWHFNALPAGTLEVVPADSSASGIASISYPGTGLGYMDRVSGEGTTLNAQFGQAAGAALRVRNPSDTRHLEIAMSTLGFDSIQLSYATQRTNNGAEKQRIEVSVDNGLTWQLLESDLEVGLAFSVVSFDLSGVEGVNNNPGLKLMISFHGANASGSSGNNRFDNLLVQGRALPPMPVNMWTGAVSTDWFDAANWSKGLPSENTDVVIEAGKPHYPVIIGSSPTVKSLLLHPDCSLTIGEDISLTVKGGLCNLKGMVTLDANAQLNIEK
jgi:hypothetical protein